MKVVSTPEAVPPLPVFSQAVISKTGMVYVSGSVGCTHELKIVEGGVQPQTRRALENMTAILKGAGVGLEDVVKVNVYLRDMPRDFAHMNEVYLEFFTGPLPARTCVGVACLPLGADVEIECVAELP